MDKTRTEPGQNHVDKAHRYTASTTSPTPAIIHQIVYAQFYSPSTPYCHSPTGLLSCLTT